MGHFRITNQNRLNPGQDAADFLYCGLKDQLWPCKVVSVTLRLKNTSLSPTNVHFELKLIVRTSWLKAMVLKTLISYHQPANLKSIKACFAFSAFYGILHYNREAILWWFYVRGWVVGIFTALSFIWLHFASNTKAKICFWRFFFIWKLNSCMCSYCWNVPPNFKVLTPKCEKCEANLWAWNMVENMAGGVYFCLFHRDVCGMGCLQKFNQILQIGDGLAGQSKHGRCWAGLRTVHVSPVMWAGVKPTPVTHTTHPLPICCAF